MKRFVLAFSILLFAATALAQHPLRPWLDSPCAHGQCGNAAIATSPIPAIPTPLAAITTDPTPAQLAQIQTDLTALIKDTSADTAAQAVVGTDTAAVTAAQTQLATDTTAEATVAAQVATDETQLQTDVAGLNSAQLARLKLTPIQQAALAKTLAKRTAVYSVLPSQPVYYYPARRRWFPWRR